jgi:tRNA C32,U32 (ribose-2'-O)-methylase TrmJ
VSLADPQKIKIGATEHECPRVVFGNRESEYSNAESDVDFTVATSEKKRKRHVARVDYRKISADPLITGQNIEHTASVTLVVDRPLSGLTNAEIKQVVDGLITNLTASSSANITKMLAGES